jgi:transposase InsO family protein
LKRYVFIEQEKNNYPIKLLCRVMELSVSGYYAWRQRLTKPPSIRRKKLAALIKDCYWENRKRYGTRRIKAALAKAGVKVGRLKIRELMTEQGLKAMQPKSFQPKTTDSHAPAPAPNLLAEVPIEECEAGKIIVGDITYLPLRKGKWCYLAVWQDKVTRSIIGWSVAETVTAELVISALKKAIMKGKVKAGAIIHSDRGSQYAAIGFRLLLQTHCFRQSMSGKGNCYDNAQAESFFSRFKTELLEGGVFEDVEQAKSEVFSYIEGYYNRTRLHSSLGYKSPMEFEMELKTKNNGGKESFVSI